MMAFHMPNASEVLIVGAGAMGSVFAALLQRAGAAVTLLDVDAALVQRINRNGITLDGPDGGEQANPGAVTNAGAAPMADFVLFFVKCHATRPAAERVSPALGPQTTIVSLQNGWGNADVLAEVLGPERLLVGVTYISATVRGPARVAYRASGPTHVGPWIDASDDRAHRFAALLRTGGIEVTVPADVRTEIWRKLVLNAATLPAAALTGLTAGALGAHPEMAELVSVIARETVAAGRADGHALDADERCRMIADVLARAGDGKGSMLQDVEAGRRTEIDVISGAVLRTAEAHAIEVPVTRALYALMQGLEQARGLA